MHSEEYLNPRKICEVYQVQESFVYQIADLGLVEFYTIEEEPHLHYDHLQELERILRLHRDLQINLEGVQAVLQLLENNRQLQERVTDLENRLRRYE